MALTTEQRNTLIWLELLLEQIKIVMALFLQIWFMLRRRRLRGNNYGQRYSLKRRLIGQMNHMRDLVGTSDVVCLNNLRMPIPAFFRLCQLLETVGGLRATKNVRLHEQVAMFLSVLSHHQKNRIIQTRFKRSGYTISKHFKGVMNALIRCGPVLLVTPQPIPEDSNETRWKHFKGCLGALDGIYLPVRVPESEKPRFRNRKGFVSVNVLAVVDKNLNFVYVLTGWEGSAADSRILRDAMGRSDGLKVPTGQYYLADSGYPNSPGFLAPFRGSRYHLREWGDGPLAPRNYKELYNMTHAKARNAVERAFGILKSRWAILRSPSFYPIREQNLIILSCCLLHNFIRLNTDVDPEEANIPEFVMNDDMDDANPNPAHFIDCVESTTEWTNFRQNLAVNMWNTRGQNANGR